MSPLSKIFELTECSIHVALDDWEQKVEAWCFGYRERSNGARLLEIPIVHSVYIFDLALERVILAYALSTPQLMQRDKNWMRVFPNSNNSVKRGLGGRLLGVDRGGTFLVMPVAGELILIFSHKEAH